MRIAFDSSPLTRPYPPGVAAATRGLLVALRERAELEVVELGPEPGEPERTWRQLRLPLTAERAGAVGIHSPVSAFAACGPGLRVSTVHELPWRHGVRENAGVGHRLWARLGVARADAVLTPTELVRRDLLAECGGGERRVHACPWGVGPLQPAPTVPPPAEEPFVLVLGGTRRKKGLDHALRGLERLEREGGPALHLVVTGPPTEALEVDLHLARRLGLGARVSTPGVVGEGERLELLARAAAVLVLSRSEGFGLPALEGLAAGAPVVVAAGSAQAEVAGAAGIRVDAGRPAEVAAGLVEALRRRPERQRAGLARAAELTWERCAVQVEHLWRSLA